MPTKSPTAQQSARVRYTDSLESRGLVQASVIVPIKYRQELVSLARELRDRWDRRRKK